MLNQATIEQLKKLRLTAIIEAAEALDRSGQASELAKEEYVAILTDRLFAEKMSDRINSLVRNANLEVPDAYLENLCMEPERGIDAGQISRLAAGGYIDKGHNVVIQAAAGGGKSFMASAFANAACRQFTKVVYLNYRDMADELMILREAPDKHKKKIASLKRIPLLVCDDWLLSDEITIQEVNELLAVIDARTRARRSTIICTQFRIEGWPELLGNSPAGDSVVDRIKNNAYVIEIKGSMSMRERFMDDELRGNGHDVG